MTRSIRSCYLGPYTKLIGHAQMNEHALLVTFDFPGFHLSVGLGFLIKFDCAVHG